MNRSPVLCLGLLWLSAVAICATPVRAQAHREPQRPRSRQNQKWYSDQITKLQAQLPSINDQIVQLQAGVDGKFRRFADIHAPALRLFR
jgi:hypothetical protein